MYSKKTKSWIKHLDFILLDVLCLQAAFVLAYISRHGLSSPYADTLYRNMAIAYTLTDFTVLIMNGTMKNVLKRGFYKEGLQTAKHIFLVAVTISMVLFSIQYGEAYSRITFYLTTLYYLIISYSVRLAWKTLLKSRKKDMLRSAVYFVTTSERAENVISRFQKNNMGHYELRGICLLDRDGIGEEILGVPVTSARNTILQYLCDKWVDEVFVSLPVGGEYPEKLIDSLSLSRFHQRIHNGTGLCSLDTVTE